MTAAEIGEVLELPLSTVSLWLKRIGLGKHLVDLALGIAKREVSPSVGCRFVMVDSKRNSVKFYERCGFTMLDTPENKERNEPVMYVDLSKVD